MHSKGIQIGSGILPRHLITPQLSPVPYEAKYNWLRKDKTRQYISITISTSLGRIVEAEMTSPWGSASLLEKNDGASVWFQIHMLSADTKAIVAISISEADCWWKEQVQTPATILPKD